MIWKIAKKEFLLNLMTFKFAVGTIVCVVLTAVFMPVLVSGYQQRLKDYNENVVANEAELRKVKVYKNISPTIYRPPTVLSVFGEGIEKQLVDSTKIKLNDVPEMSAASGEVNPYLSIYPTLDVALIVKIVTSILALLVAYDVISGERERGTLKLILSNTAARYHVLLAKLLAGLMTLVVPLTIAFIVGLLILLFSSMVDLTGSDWARIGLMYLASLVFIAAMYNFGLLFSCLTKGSATSLMFVLLFWVVFVIVIPNGSLYLAGQLRPFESREKIDGQIQSLWERYESEVSEFAKTLPPGGGCTQELGAFGQVYELFCSDDFIERNQKKLAFTEPLKIKYTNQISQVQQKYYNSLIEQKHLADNIARISPIFLYDNVVSVLSGTDFGGLKDFTQTVQTHRTKIIKYIRSKTENFSSPLYFTTSKESDWEEWGKYSEAVAKGQTVADRIKVRQARMDWVKKRAKNIQPIDLQDLPPSVYKTGVVKSLQRALFDLVLLVFSNVLFFALSFVAFLSYDVR